MDKRTEKLIDALIEVATDAWSDALTEDDCPIDMIREKVGKPALYENMAEEAAEVAHAALKVSRIMRGENPTPEKLNDAMLRLKHELCDLQVVCDVTGLECDYGYMTEKLERWIDRLEEK